jgi:hypothetical protein
LTRTSPSEKVSREKVSRGKRNRENELLRGSLARPACRKALLPAQMSYIPVHGLPEPLLDAMSRRVAQHVPGLGDVSLGMPHIASTKIGMLRIVIL